MSPYLFNKFNKQIRKRENNRCKKTNKQTNVGYGSGSCSRSDCDDLQYFLRVILSGQRKRSQQNIRWVLWIFCSSRIQCRMQQWCGCTAHPTVVWDYPNPAWMGRHHCPKQQQQQQQLQWWRWRWWWWCHQGKDDDTSKCDRLQLWWWGGGSLLFHLLSLHLAHADRGEWREREREGEEGRIKTNPLCELVLVAMATIITSHLGEQEQGERGGGGGETGRRYGMKRCKQERGRSWGKTKKKEEKKRKCQIPGSVQKCHRRERGGGGGGGVCGGVWFLDARGTTFWTRDPPLTQTRKDHSPARTQSPGNVREPVSYLPGRGGEKKKTN